MGDEREIHPHFMNKLEEPSVAKADEHPDLELTFWYVMEPKVYVQLYFPFGSMLYTVTICIQTKEVLNRDQMSVNSKDIDKIFCDEIDVHYHSETTKKQQA